MPKKSYRQAINEALRQEMERDHRVILMGEDVAGGMGAPGEDDAWGGPLGVTKGLEPIFGRDRVLDTPITESAFVGAAAGAAATGLRPVAELMFVDFFAVYEAAAEAIERARAGQGPSLLHVKLTRYYGHFEGDAMTYRAPGEIDRLKTEKDCLKLFRQRVTEAGLLEPAQLDEIDKEAGRIIDQALAAAKAAPPPTEADLLTDVYASY